MHRCQQGVPLLPGVDGRNPLRTSWYGFSQCLHLSQVIPKWCELDDVHPLQGVDGLMTGLESLIVLAFARIRRTHQNWLYCLRTGWEKQSMDV